MKVLNKKIIISFMALLLLAIASFSVLTFMFADDSIAHAERRMVA